jgi:hypothetical protein
MTQEKLTYTLPEDKVRCFESTIRYSRKRIFSESSYGIVAEKEGNIVMEAKIKFSVWSESDPDGNNEKKEYHGSVEQYMIMPEDGDGWHADSWIGIDYGEVVDYDGVSGMADEVGD